jgi:hypothetical protein
MVRFAERRPSARRTSRSGRPDPIAEWPRSEGLGREPASAVAAAAPHLGAPRSSGIRAAVVGLSAGCPARAEKLSAATRYQAAAPTAGAASRCTAGTRPACDRARSTAFRTGNTPGSSDQPSDSGSDDACSAVVGDHGTPGTGPRQHATRDVHRGEAVAGQVLGDALRSATGLAHHEQRRVGVDLA